MLWLLVAVSAYLILAVVYLVDKYLLVGPIPNPKVYTFYIGILGLSVLILAPFVGFSFPGAGQIILSLTAGIFFTFFLFWWFRAIRLFEVSRVVPAVGGLVPIFTFFLIFLFSGGREFLQLREFSAFILLIAGTVLITQERGKKISFSVFRVSATAALFMALSFALSKYVYLGQPFWSGYIWIRIGGGLAALGFLLFPEVRNELFKTRISFQKKTLAIFFSNQAAGASANILQNWAIALVPLVYLAFINALQGIQYVFLFIFAILLSLKFPRILKEEISQKTIIQKIAAIFLIGAGLAILSLNI